MFHSATLPSPPSYRLVRKLGQGASATVYLAQPHAQSKSADVAIKVITRSNLQRRREERVVQEIAILKRLRHENVVRLLDLEWDNQYVFIVMELCQLGNLKEFLLRQPRRCLVEQDARYFLRQLAAGLSFIWSHSLTHRDLKTENLLLSTNPNPAGLPRLKIGDFGIAHYDEDSRRAREDDSGAILTDKIGTLAYMAPEVLKDDQYDARCDLWSVGVIFYEMLVGMTPFPTTNTDDLLAKIISPTPAKITLPAVTASKISLPAQSLVSALLTRDPAHRLTFKGFLGHPYIDLAHVPGPESLNMGLDCVTEAAERDERLAKALSSKTVKNIAKHAKELEEVVALYADGIAHFLAYHQYVGPRDPIAAEVTSNISTYMDRAEILKEQAQSLSSQPTGEGNAINSADKQGDWQPLDSLEAMPGGWIDIPPIGSDSSGFPSAYLDILNRACHTLADAQRLEATQPGESLQYYDRGLGELLRAVSLAPNDDERQRLRTEACDWLDQADRAKEVVTVQMKERAMRGWEVKGTGVIRKGSLINIVYDQG